MYSVGVKLTAQVEHVTIVLCTSTGRVVCDILSDTCVVDEDKGPVEHIEVYLYKGELGVPATALRIEITRYTESENVKQVFRHDSSVGGGSAEVYSLSLFPSVTTKSAPTYDII